MTIEFCEWHIFFSLYLYQNGTEGLGWRNTKDCLWCYRENYLPGKDKKRNLFICIYNVIVFVLYKSSNFIKGTFASSYISSETWAKFGFKTSQIGFRRVKLAINMSHVALQNEQCWLYQNEPNGLYIVKPCWLSKWSHIGYLETSQIAFRT